MLVKRKTKTYTVHVLSVTSGADLKIFSTKDSLLYLFKGVWLFYGHVVQSSVLSEISKTVRVVMHTDNSQMHFLIWFFF